MEKEEVKMPENRRRGNISPSKSLAEIDSERHRLPASEANLTAEERASLKDPNWIDEDEADAIICRRREKEPGNQPIPIREYLRRRGIKVDG
jgi:hypothetical protein